MLATNIASAINAQVGRELFNSAQYLQFASIAYAMGLVATSKWIRGEAEGERKHADGLVDYLDARGVAVTIPTIESPATVPDMATMAASILSLEEATTAGLTEILALAEQAKDRQTYALMLDYIEQQREEEDGARRLGRFVAMSSDLSTLDQQVSLGLGK